MAETIGPVSNYKELLAQMDLMCQWLQAHRIPVHKNRIAEYRKTFSQALELSQDPDSEIDAAAAQKLVDNFHDCSELILIAQGFKDAVCETLRKTLAQAVNGPLSLQAEAASNSDARNKAFELVMAAQLRCAGLPVRLEEPTDAIVTVRNTKCFLHRFASPVSCA